jgi:hypothetical protein
MANLHWKRFGRFRLGLVPNEMFLRQDQEFLLLPKHGTTCLNLSIVQHLPNASIFAQVFTKASRGPRGRCRERLVVVL